REVDLAGRYRDLLAGSPGSVVSAARIIADAGRHAVVFHCAAGKDRTGVLAAVVLDAVGVPADAIVEDYALSGQRLDRVRQRLVKLPSYRGLPPVRTGYLGVEAVVMRRFLTTLRAEFGGGAQWLLQHGFGAAELRGLRDTLVEPV
ncbi:MAG: tyrosine-protein phosphatase, partial [Haloechinothrix sp.]